MCNYNNYTGGVTILLILLCFFCQQTGIGLQHLLHWLMGAPAGLKLNTFLAHFLGNFFLYHVYLWIGYLSVLLPIMTSLLWCIAGAGILGLSVQLALFSDLLSVLTFHIYCFYVYAARIYSLQISGLLSLARLFQGKKWNVLRQRVDSCSYDVDQLFMGTLLFTILFFMLPTTALFYVVFTLLRLLILCIQSLLTLLRELLDTFPWFSLSLWLGGSNMLNKEVHFQVLPVSPWQPASLSLQIQLMSLQEALQVGQTPVVTLKPEKMSLLLIFRKLVRGQLIYPWGGDHS
nr:phosphatidylinositol N-acetylglucosaminyltransferase subunit Q-like [Lytechinus pictus]